MEKAKWAKRILQYSLSEIYEDEPLFSSKQVAQLCKSDIQSQDRVTLGWE